MRKYVRTDYIICNGFPEGRGRGCLGADGKPSSSSIYSLHTRASQPKGGDCCLFFILKNRMSMSMPFLIVNQRVLASTAASVSIPSLLVSSLSQQIEASSKVLDANKSSTYYNQLHLRYPGAFAFF